MEIPLSTPETPEGLETLQRFVAEMGGIATRNGVEVMLRQILEAKGNTGPVIHENLITAFTMGVIFALKADSELGVDLRPLLKTPLKEMILLKNIGRENPGN